MVEAEVEVQSRVVETIGDPPSYYETSLNEDRTRRLVLTKTSKDAWGVRTYGFKKYFNFKNEEKLTETFHNELLRVKMFAGELYVFVDHQTYSSRKVRVWERETVTNKTFRDICKLFGLTPEDLTWGVEFTPSYVSDSEWKEPFEVDFIPLKVQGELIADRLRAALDLKAHLEELYPDFADLVDHEIDVAKNRLMKFLTFEDISTATDPKEIPKWAWKWQYAHCQRRVNKDLKTKYVAEGLISKK